MPHVITALCLREGSCATVCPVECIVPGDPTDEYPWFYIDADTCIDCGACEAECPHNAIFLDTEVPNAFKAKGGERLSYPKGTPGCNEEYDETDHNGDPIHLDATRTLQPGEVVDLTEAVALNADFFKKGPGYAAVK